MYKVFAFINNCVPLYMNNAKENKKDYDKIYYEANKKRMKKRNAKYYQNNKDKIRKQVKLYRKINNENVKKYRETNKERFKKQRKEYIKKRMLVDPMFALKEYIRRLIQTSFRKRNFEKKNKTNEILGCSSEYFKQYIESKFHPWMNWQNKGLYNGTLNYGWDLDHIIPISTANTEKDVIRLSHYTNFQPLCSYINRCIKRANHISH